MEPKETWIKETLESADGIGRAKANPFLYDKVINRMHQARVNNVPKNVYVRWVMAAALLVGLNVVSLVHYHKHRATQNNSANAFTGEYFSYLNNY